MLLLINANQIQPPIAPIGLDYIAHTLIQNQHDVQLLDLCLEKKPKLALETTLQNNSFDLIGISFRNVDDCFWPSCKSFVSELKELVRDIHKLTDTPIVLGGVGYSLFPKRLLLETNTAFGIRGDGELAMLKLIEAIKTNSDFEHVPGLLRHHNSQIITNPPAWSEQLQTLTARNFIDNVTYYKRGGQIGIETKRGCPRHCSYCADFLAKGKISRLRKPQDLADELANLLTKGIDTFHTCDSEFNIPYNHAAEVCKSIIQKGLGDRIQWYAYLAVVPFDAQLASLMKQAGCVGINFTADSASPTMLQFYNQNHRKTEIAQAVTLCKQNNIRVMIDLLLGGPGETPETLSDTIGFMKKIDPDCVGAAMGLRLYPNTPATIHILQQTDPQKTPGLKRRYNGNIDLLKPTFYISPALGDKPAELVREIIGGDKRFFPPESDMLKQHTDHNYNNNDTLTQAIANGARGAYWDILRELR